MLTTEPSCFSPFPFFCDAPPGLCTSICGIQIDYGSYVFCVWNRCAIISFRQHEWAGSGCIEYEAVSPRNRLAVWLCHGRDVTTVGFGFDLERVSPEPVSRQLPEECRLSRRSMYSSLGRSRSPPPALPCSLTPTPPSAVARLNVSCTSPFESGPPFNFSNAELRP